MTILRDKGFKEAIKLKWGPYRVEATHSLVFHSPSKLMQFLNHSNSSNQQKNLIQLELGRNKSKCLKSTQMNLMPALLGLHLDKYSYQGELHVFCQRKRFPAAYLHLSSPCDPTVAAAALFWRSLRPKMSSQTWRQSSHRWSRAKEEGYLDPCLLEWASWILRKHNPELKSHVCTAAPKLFPFGCASLLGLLSAL